MSDSSIALQKKHMSDEAARALLGRPVNDSLIRDLLEIGFKHGMEAKANEVQPLITRLEIGESLDELEARA